GPFEFSLHTADIFPWLDGSQTGPVPDDAQGSMAEALSSFLRTTRRELRLAAFGVQRQEWLLRQLHAIQKRGVSIQAVVDQERGDFGDWRSENFTSSDTPQIVDTIGVANVIPDLGPSGQPRTGSIMHNKFMVADDRIW